MRASFGVFALLPALALAEISITAPSDSNYWVQNASNIIRWTYESGDPNPISIIVRNSENTTLNGDFSIAEYVEISEQSFTVTNVTLRTGGSYQVLFVNPTNASDVFATSPSYDVRSSDTPPATDSAGSTTASSTATSTSSSSATTTGTSDDASETENGASSLITSGLTSVIAGGLVALSGLLL